MMRLSWLGLACAMVAGGCSHPDGHQVAIRTVNSSSVAGVSLRHGDLLFNQGQFALALDEYRHILRDDPDQADAVERIAIVYGNLNRPDLSDRYFQLALAMRPTKVAYYRNYAVMLRSQGRATEAADLESDLQQATGEGSAPAPVNVAATAQPPKPVTELAATPVAQVNLDPPSQGAVLIRQSLEEVTLRTAPLAAARPASKAAPSVQTATPAPLTRSAPVSAPSPASVAQPLPTRLVNANGNKGFAHRYVGLLARQGWRRVELGDAVFRLKNSQILYPPARAAEAQQLAKLLPFRTRAMATPIANRIIVLIGRDAQLSARRSATKARAV